MEYVSSSLMLAEIYTKEFTDEQKWTSLRKQIGILSPAEKASGMVSDHMALLNDIPHVKKHQQDPQRMPSELLHLDHGLGWHQTEKGEPYAMFGRPRTQDVSFLQFP